MYCVTVARNKRLKEFMTLSIVPYIHGQFSRNIGIQKPNGLLPSDVHAAALKEHLEGAISSKCSDTDTSVS